MLRSCVHLTILAALGCASERDGTPADDVRASVDIGVPSDDGLYFVRLEEGGELRLQTFGQGGTHVLFAVQTVGVGRRAFASVTLRNLTTGAEVIAPAPVRPQLFICDDNGVCDLVPLLVMTAGLTETDAERDGLGIQVEVDVENEAGVRAHATREAVLSTEDL